MILAFGGIISLKYIALKIAEMTKQCTPGADKYHSHMFLSHVIDCNQT